MIHESETKTWNPKIQTGSIRLSTTERLDLEVRLYTALREYCQFRPTMYRLQSVEVFVEWQCRCRRSASRVSTLATQQHSTTVPTHVPDCAASRDRDGTLIVLVVFQLSLSITSTSTSAALLLCRPDRCNPHCCILCLGCYVTAQLWMLLLQLLKKVSEKMGCTLSKPMYPIYNQLYSYHSI